MLTATDEQPWYQKAAEKIVRERKSMELCLLELGVEDVTHKEADGIYKSKYFQAILRAERHRYWNELASDPGFGKNSVIGMMLDCAQNLAAEGSYDKAADALNKLAGIAGWKGAETNVNVFEKVTAKDIEEIKASFAQTGTPGRASKASN